MISDEAVEAATSVFPWQAADYLDTDTVRAALEAASPHMLERAYNAGHLDGMNGAPNTNPYRIQS